MKRIVNVRYAAVLAAMSGLGAGLCYASLRGGWSYYCFIPAVPVAAAFIILFIAKRSPRGIILTLAAAALFLACAGGMYAKLKQYSDTPVAEGSGYEICGTVYEKGTGSYGEYIKLKNLTIGGQSVGGCMYVYLAEEYGQFCDVGYSVSFVGSVSVYDAFAYGGVSSSRLIEDIRYTSYQTGNVASEYGFSLFGGANSAVRELFDDCADDDTAAIAYAMLTGNTEGVEEGTMDSFRYGGVAHVFAVSGLHIGLVYAAVCAVLKRLRANRYAAAAISIVLIFLYSGVCGFTLSSLRAAIMCTVSAILKLCGGKYDLLSSVCISFTLLTLINPLNILSVGFQLSVAAVAGIAVFCPQITRFLRRIKVPRKISSAAAVSLSAQITTFPILLSSFGYVSWASLLLNIIFVPLLSLIFTLLFACTIAALIFTSVAQFLLLIPLSPLGAVTSVLVSVQAEEALISGFSFGAFAPLYYLAALTLSQKVNLKIPLRSAVALILAAVLAAGVALKNYVPDGALKIYVSSYYGQSCAVLFRTGSGDVLVISETPSSYDISSLIQDCGAGGADAVVILGGEESIFAYNELGMHCDVLYVYDENVPLQPYNGVTVNYLENFTVAGINFSYCGGCDIVAEYGGLEVGVSVGESVTIRECDILVSSAEAGLCRCGVHAYFGQSNFAYSAYSLGDLQFMWKDGKLYYIRDKLI